MFNFFNGCLLRVSTTLRAGNKGNGITALRHCLSDIPFRLCSSHHYKRWYSHTRRQWYENLNLLRHTALRQPAEITVFHCISFSYFILHLLHGPHRSPPPPPPHQLPAPGMASSSHIPLLLDPPMYRLCNMMEDLEHINNYVKCAPCLTKTCHDNAQGTGHADCLLARVRCCLAFEVGHDNRECDNVLPKKKGHLLACTQCGIWEVYHLHTVHEFSNPQLCPWILFKQICFCLWHDEHRRSHILQLLSPTRPTCLATFYRTIISGKDRFGSPLLHKVVSLIANCARGLSDTLDYETCSLCDKVLPKTIPGSMFDTHDLCLSCYDSPSGRLLRE